MAAKAPLDATALRSFVNEAGRPFIISLTGILFFILSATFVQAESFGEQTAPDEPTLTAPHLEYISDSDEFVAEGGAHMIREGMSLDADRIRYKKATRDVYAEGGVVYRDSDVILTADRANVNLDTGIGEASGEVSLYYVAEDVRISGEKLEKRGWDYYYLESCTLTTCEGDNPAWSLRAARADLHLGRSISGSHVRFNIKKVPVIYTPYFWAPALVQKQSGFLFPEFGYGNRDGAFLKLRYYWMLAVNRDATFHLDGFSKRGIGKGLKFRYLESFGSRGNLWLYHIDDDRTEKEYAEIKFTHDQDFGARVTGFARANWVSEGNYYREFIPTHEEKLQRYLENSAHLSWQPGISRVFGTARVYQNLDGPSSGIPQTYELGTRIFSHGWRPIPLHMGVESRLDQFSRDTGPAGQRFLLAPRLVGSLRLPFVTFTPSASWIGTWYSVSELADSDFSRETWKLGAVVASKVFRSYGGFTHYMEPEVSHEYVSSWGSPPPVLDSVDFIGERNQTTLRLTNRLYRGGTELLRIALSEGYDFLDNETSWSDFEAAAYINGPLSFSGLTFFNVYEHNFSSAQADIAYTWGRSGYVASGYRFEKKNVNTVTLASSIRPWEQVELYGRAWYDTKGSGLRELEVRTSYLSKCWGVRFKVFDRPEETKYMAEFSLSGLGAFSAGEFSAGP